MVSLSWPARMPTENISMGGSTLSMLKKLNGAAFGPLVPSVVTSAMGRGTIEPASNLYCSA
jgi:hypothetical protein